jgi:hypothetical protein
MMRRTIVAAAVMAFLGCFAYAAPAAGDAAPEKQIGLLFSLTSLATPLLPYSDGFQAGAGVKYWPTKNIATRFLLAGGVVPSSIDDTSITTLGLSAAGEYHFRPGDISPYLGGVLGLSTLFDSSGAYLDYCAGVYGGVEIVIVKNFSCFCEYSALFKRTIDGFAFDLAKEARFGLIVYF